MPRREPRPFLITVVALAISSATACTTARYVGSIGRDGSYTNRGFGVLLRLAQGGLNTRWQPIDPNDPETVPRPWRPKTVRSPLDRDGDGYLEVTEITRRTEPALRLLSRTSTTTHVDVSVEIIGGKSSAAPLDGVMNMEIKRAVTSSAARDRAFASIEARTLAQGFPARIAELTGEGPFGERRQVRMALVDQPGFLAEEGITRRQVVKIALYAPELTEALRRDHDLLLEALLLNRRGATESVRERW